MILRLPKRSSSTDDFPGEFYQRFEERLISILHSLIRKIQEQGTTQYIL